MSRIVKKKKQMKGRKRGGASVPCPRCHKNSHVVLTRRVDGEVMRNRECTGHHPFTTIEQVKTN